MKRITLAAGVAAALSLSACGGGADDVPVAQYASTAQLVQALPRAQANTTGIYTLSGSRSTYSLVRVQSGYRITDNSGVLPTAVLNDMQAIQFADVTINLGIGDKSKTIASAHLKRLIELYVAFFNRLPDADGLSYWIDQYRGGLTVNQIAESFYTAAIQYSALTGYTRSMGNSDFVRLIYKNVLGRSGATAPPDEDVQYWSGRMSKGGMSKGELVSTMLDSAHTFDGHATWGWVPKLLDNKIAISEYFTVQQGINYNTPEESIAKTMAIAAAVTSSDITQAKGLVGFSDPTFDLTTVSP